MLSAGSIPPLRWQHSHRKEDMKLNNKNDKGAAILLGQLPGVPTKLEKSESMSFAAQIIKGSQEIKKLHLEILRRNK